MRCCLKMVSETCCLGCSMEFDSVNDMQEHQFNSCPNLLSSSIAVEQSNSENSSSSWNSSTLLSPTSTENPRNNSMSFSSISSVSFNTPSRTDLTNNQEGKENVATPHPATVQPNLNSSREAAEEVAYLIDIYSKYVSQPESGEEEVSEVNDLFNDDMSASDL